MFDTLLPTHRLFINLQSSVLALGVMLIPAYALGAISGASTATMEPPHDFQGCLSCHFTSAFDEPNLIPNGSDLVYVNKCLGSCHDGTGYSHIDGSLLAKMNVHSSDNTSSIYGNWYVGCKACHNQHKQEQNIAYGTTYGKFIKDEINLELITDVEDGNSIKSGKKTVKHIRQTGLNSFADGNTTIDGICQVCHTETSHWKNDGTGIGIGVHAGLEGSNCMTCHPHGQGFKAACDICHGFPPVDAATLVIKYDSDTSGSTGSVTAGAHNEHTANQSIGCDACHYNNRKGFHNDGLPLDVTIGFGPNVPIPHGGDYVGQSGVTYDAFTTLPTTIVDPAPTIDTMECSNIYCHGNYAGSGLNASPAWNDSLTGDCGTCHAAENTPGSTPNSGSHTRHAATDNKGYACTLCHNTIVSGSGPDTYTIADTDAHVNGTIDWAFDTSDSRLNADAVYSEESGTASPTDGIAPNRAFNTCNNVYCHSIVQTVTGGALTLDTADYKTPTWGDATSVRCGECHNNYDSHDFGPYNSPSPATGSHTEHLAYKFTATGTNYKCDLCHKYGTKDVSIPDCNGCHNNGGKTEHVDGEVDIMFDPTFVSNTGTYNGTALPGDGFGSCSDTYCHSNGTSVSQGVIPANTSPTWGTPGPLACTSCHSYAPDYANNDPKANHHDRHVATLSYTCNTCHLDTTADGVTISDKTKHVNGQYDLKADPSVLFMGNPVVFDYSYDPGGGTCTNVTCHNDKLWGNTSLTASVSWTSSGAICSEVKDFTITVTSSNGEPPYRYTIDWGDGSPIYEGTDNVHSHIYGDTANRSVTWSVRDSRQNTLSGGSATNVVSPHNGNFVPTPDVTVSKNGLEVTLTDLTIDPDYNLCGHSGDALIKIDWGPGVYVDYYISLTDTATPHTFTYTYANSGSNTIKYGVQDNVMTYPNFIDIPVTVP